MSDLFTPQWSLFKQILLTKCKWICQEKNIWATVEVLLPGLPTGSQQMGKAIDSPSGQFPFPRHHKDFAAGVMIQWGSGWCTAFLCCEAHSSICYLLGTWTKPQSWDVLIWFQISWGNCRRGVRGERNKGTNELLQTAVQLGDFTVPIQTTVESVCWL